MITSAQSIACETSNHVSTVPRLPSNIGSPCGANE